MDEGENAGCDDTIYLSAELFDESNILYHAAHVRIEVCSWLRLWRSRYLVAVESFVSDDGQTAIRLARTLADGSTGACGSSSSCVASTGRQAGALRTFTGLHVSWHSRWKPEASPDELMVRWAHL